MAQHSFDVSTGVDLQEVDNAINQAHKEIANRYDFKGTDCSLEFDRKEGSIQLGADDEYRLQALLGVVREKLTRRGVPLRNLVEGDVDSASLGRAKQTLSLKQGIDRDTARAIAKDVKGQKLKKVQVQIQGDQVRVMSPSRDALQQVIAFLKTKNYGVELTFGNYR